MSTTIAVLSSLCCSSATEGPDEPSSATCGTGEGLVATAQAVSVSDGFTRLRSLKGVPSPAKFPFRLMGIFTGRVKPVKESKIHHEPILAPKFTRIERKKN